MTTRIAIIMFALFAMPACHKQEGERLHDVVERYCAELQRDLRRAADAYDSHMIEMSGGVIEDLAKRHQIAYRFQFCLSARVIDDQTSLELDRRVDSALYEINPDIAKLAANDAPVHELADLADEISRFPIRD